MVARNAAMVAPTTVPSKLLVDCHDHTDAPAATAKATNKTMWTNRNMVLRLMRCDQSLGPR